MTVSSQVCKPPLPVRPETGPSAPATPTPWPPVTPSRPGPATAGTQQKRRGHPAIHRESSRARAVFPQRSRRSSRSGCECHQFGQRRCELRVDLRATTAIHARLPSSCCWAQPDPPLSPTYPAQAEHVAARDAANFRPLNVTATLLIRVTLPFLSRRWMERLHETLRACNQTTNMNTLISAGVEFSPATYILQRSNPGICSVVSGRLSAPCWPVRAARSGAGRGHRFVR